jgi:hypothetical protein
MQVSLHINTKLPNMLWRIKNKLTIRINLVSKTTNYAYRKLNNYPHMERKMMINSVNWSPEKKPKKVTT